MSSHWPTADQQPDAALVTGDAVTEITRLKGDDGGTPVFTALDIWVDLSLVETRTFPDGVVADQVRDEALTAGT